LLIGLAVVTLGCAMLATAPPDRAEATTDCGLTAPANITVANSPNMAGAFVSYPAPTASGTCGTVTCTPASGSFYPLGTTLVTCSATTTPVVRASFTITVTDAQPPSISVPGNITTGNTPGQGSALVSFPPPSASDNAPGVTVSCSRPSPSLFAIGTTAVPCTARDAAGNTATGSFNVTVQDNEAPVLDVPDAIRAKAKHGKRKATVTYGPVTVRDNSGASLAASCDPASGGRFRVGTTTVTCKATDAAGNVGSASFAVRVSRRR
jgi:HYR domain-containing protein